MRRFRLLLLSLAPVVALLVFADPALATTYGGEGLWGPSNLTQITFVMFGILGFFPLLIIALTLLTSWGERRRHKKFHAQRARELASEDRGGW